MYITNVSPPPYLTNMNRTGHSKKERRKKTWRIHEYECTKQEELQRGGIHRTPPKTPHASQHTYGIEGPPKIEDPHEWYWEL